eukprot:6189731-Pleurochrysis_carterae.AAC.3
MGRLRAHAMMMTSNGANSSVDDSSGASDESDCRSMPGTDSRLLPAKGGTNPLSEYYVVFGRKVRWPWRHSVWIKQTVASVLVSDLNASHRIAHLLRGLETPALSALDIASPRGHPVEGCAKCVGLAAGTSRLPCLCSAVPRRNDATSNAARTRARRRPHRRPQNSLRVVR